MFKVNSKDTKMTYRRRFGVFIVDFEQISQIVATFPLLTLEYVNAGWERIFHWRCSSETYVGPCQTSMTEIFAEIVND